jgi:hypothetical protein
MTNPENVRGPSFGNSLRASGWSEERLFRHDAEAGTREWEITADKLSKAGWSWGVLQPWTVAGERRSLPMRTAMMESVSLRRRMKKLTAFAELESAIRCAIATTTA